MSALTTWFNIITLLFQHPISLFCLYFPLCSLPPSTIIYILLIYVIYYLQKLHEEREFCFIHYFAPCPRQCLVYGEAFSKYLLNEWMKAWTTYGTRAGVPPVCNASLFRYLFHFPSSFPSTAANGGLLGRLGWPTSASWVLGGPAQAELLSSPITLYCRSEWCDCPRDSLSSICSFSTPHYIIAAQFSLVLQSVFPDNGVTTFVPDKWIAGNI